PRVGRVPPCLVVARHAADVKAVPGSNGLAVELEQPQPQPAVGECGPRELSVERVVSECRVLPLPASTVKREQRVEISLERLRVREAKVRVGAFERARPPSELRAKVAAAAAQIGAPTPVRQTKHRTCLAPPARRVDEVAPPVSPR